MANFPPAASALKLPYVQPRDINIHNARIAEALMILDLPSPYYPTTVQKEHAYGTPIYFPAGFNNYRFWMVGAPYPTTETLAARGGLGAAKFENPCVYVSNDGENFIVPPGLTNPLATSAGLSDANSYYNDPYICCSLDQKKLYVIFGWTNRSATAVTNSLMVMESTDGVNWTAPVSIYDSTVAGGTTSITSASLFPTATGWTCLAVEVVTTKIQIMTTTSTSPYSGWGAFANCVAVHPLGRPWWHAHFVPTSNNTVIGMGVDGTSSGGSVYTFKSIDGGLTFTVQPFSSSGSSASGSWYRPSLCIVNDGPFPGALFYTSRIGPLLKTGFWVQKARLSFDSAVDLGHRAMVRGAVHSPALGPVNYLKRSLLAWDSFQRADSATSAGIPDGAPVGSAGWVNQSGAWGILGNRAYFPVNANNIMTLDLKVNDYEFEFQFSAVGTSCNLIFGFLDASNFYRVRSNGNVERIIAGAVDRNFGVLPSFYLGAGDMMRIRKEGIWVSIYSNDRIIDSFSLTDANDTALKSSTIVGIQSNGTSSTYITSFVARIPG